MKFKDNIVRLLTQPEISGENYYWITLLADSEGNLEWGIQSQWCGYTDDRPRREIREGALYHGEQQRAQCHDFGEPALLINDQDDVKYFYGFGGHALVAENVGRARFARLIAPSLSGILCVRHNMSPRNMNAEQDTQTQSSTVAAHHPQRTH